MNTPQHETSLEELVSRLAQLERANILMSEELVALRAAQPIIFEQATTHAKEVPFQPDKKPSRQGRLERRKSRRGLLRKGLGIAAATVGTGAVLAIATDTVSANGTEGPTTFTNNGGNSPAVTAMSSSPPTSKVPAIQGDGGSGYTGIAGFTSSNDIRAAGVFGQGGTVGVAGQVRGATTAPTVKVGVYGTGSNRSSTSPLGGVGVEGESDTGTGVVGVAIDPTGFSDNALGVAGFSTSASDNSAGVLGKGRNGVIGQAIGSTIVHSNGRVGVYGTGSNGSNLGGIGVKGVSDTGMGVFGQSDTGTGVFGQSTTKAGVFSGNVDVTGMLTKGGGSFKIDHPLDPANKYLSHSFVESPDMKNVYDGIVVLDPLGEAVVDLPAWFEALNKEFRYQLTAIGAPGPNLFIAEEISNQRFKIAGGRPGMKVCWQVTGIRQDAWANEHRIAVEQEKSAREKGYYLHPTLHGHSSERSIISTLLELK